MAAIRDRCPTCGFHPATVSPSDAATAARSFPRRYRALLVRPDEEGGDDDLVRRWPPGGGLSALEHTAMATEGMGAAAAAVRSVAVRDEPEVTIAVAEPGPLPTVDAVLEGLAVAADNLADGVGGYAPEEWGRCGVLADGERVSALDLARNGVHMGIHHLRDAARVIEQVRGRPT